MPRYDRHRHRDGDEDESDGVVSRARELVEFARRHGYRIDELIEIIETVG
jgi:hypothetical protein